MKKPLLEDYSLTEDDLEWAVTREKEIDNLSYKKFMPKILVCIVVVGTILFTFVFPSVFLSPKCSQTLSCHIGDTLLHMLKLAAFMCIPGFWVSLPLAMISKWIYKSSAKNDERLQRVWRYNALLNQYNNISDKDKVSDKVINEKENIISEKEIKKDGDMFLFEEKPFTGTSIGFRTDADEKKSKVEGSEKETNFKFTTYKNGRKISIKHWQNGVDIGPQIQWYENGRKKSEAHFENGKRNGPMLGWHENGNKEYEGRLVDDQLDGLQVEWYENGEKKMEQSWKEGKAHGLCINYYENGSKKGEGYFRNGVKQGFFVGWDENGEKSGEEYFEDGIERSSFSESLLKRSLEIGKDAGCSREELPGNVEEATVLVLTTLCAKVCLADLFPSGKATTAACFLTICTSAVYSELKESNPEIELIDLFGKVGNAAFMVFEPKEREKIILEGWEMCRGLVANIKNNEDLKSWFARTYEGINLYVISDSGLSAEDKVVTDVLTPLYLNLCESRESWS